jgi:hypothetical protein
MKRATGSYFLALRASARFGRAAKLRDAGKKEAAVQVAREVLAILSHPHVIRANPAEASVLCCATILLESLAHELGVPGASPRDIVDAIHAIRNIGPEYELAKWLPYLEYRVIHTVPSDAA